MNFASIPSGSAVFVDANTLVFNSTSHPLLGPACQQLLVRIANQDLLGFTSANVLSDLAHRVMTLEAMMLFGWPAAGIAQRLRHQPLEVQKLSAFRQAVDEVPKNGIRVFPVTADLVMAAAQVSLQTGLLSDDALIVAVMQAEGLTSLASHDADFDRVPGITRYGPV